MVAATRLWYCYHTVRGNLHTVLHAAHEQHGDVVRIAPDELSYIDPRAWGDIYGHRAGKAEVRKYTVFYSSIINADRSRHCPLRKQASHGFSERALRSQEQVFEKYADLFIQRSDESAASRTSTVDILDWFNFPISDVMGHLVFGQSFDCFTNWGYHP